MPATRGQATLPQIARIDRLVPSRNSSGPPSSTAAVATAVDPIGCASASSSPTAVTTIPATTMIGQ
ncbi:hypothetical protein D3C80_1325590 [compost metagenome]